MKEPSMTGAKFLRLRCSEVCQNGQVETVRRFHVREGTCSIQSYTSGIRNVLLQDAGDDMKVLEIPFAD
jgi:hypothetical protein